MKSTVWMVERNTYGAWVIRGCIGMRQYYFYTKREAVALYRAEVEEKRHVSGNSVYYTK